MRDLKQVLNQNKSDRKKADTYNYNYNTTECNIYPCNTETGNQKIRTDYY